MSREILTAADKEFIVKHYDKMSVFQMAIRMDIKTENRRCPIIEDFIRNSGLKANSSTPVQPISVAIPPPDAQAVTEKILGEPVTVENAENIDEGDVEACSIEDCATYLKEIGLNIHTPLGERERREIGFLVRQLSSTRFILMYKNLRSKDYKKLFKEEFAKGLYGRGDMPTEEVNDFMDLAQEMIAQHDCRCKIKELEKQQTAKETTKTQALVYEQVISDLNKQHGESIKRAGEIKKTLGTHREQRLKENRAVGLTVALLLEAVYDVEKRAELVKLQDKTDEKLTKVISQLEEFADAKALILGVGLDELKEGGM